jgi:DNA helicase-2/ATP-dependent DNA helicase PcrA
MAKRNALDFDDLLLKVLELFEREPGTRDAYARRFEHVLVDEYQDTNRVQYRLMCHLAGFHGNLTVCGDPDQSIYAWRGADVRNILDFESDFPGAAVVRLEQNYRSTKNILRAAQGLIRHNRERKEKDLWSAGPEGEPIRVIECADEDDEAVEIATRIRELVAGGRRADEMAVFYRVNFMQRALERALRLAGVPYRVVAGVEFFQRREIKDLIAYLRLLVNPRDDEAFLRAVGAPQRGVGEKSLEQLAAWAAGRGLPLLAASAADGLDGVVRGRARASLAAFGRLIAELAPLREGPAALALRALIAAVDYEQWLAREQDDVDRQANVDELLANAETYDRIEPAGGLRGFLQDVALVSDADAYQEDAARASLMTLHTAKGLEFPVVFIAGLEEELLPHARAIEEAFGGSEVGVEEERRLCYVGMTRAKEQLVLTHVRVRRHFGAEQFCRPSRFLDELPPELVAGTERTDEQAEEALGAYVPTGSSGLDLREGDLVLHSHFGRGRIRALLGAGINARATVDFELHGRKQLLLQYAKLQVLERGGA